MALSLIEQMEMGRAVVEKSGVGTEFARWPEALYGEIRSALLPGSYFAAATATDGRAMTMLPDGRWKFVTSLEQLKEDLMVTWAQLNGVPNDDGTIPSLPSQIRVDTLRRLTTADEWMVGEEAFLHGVATMQARRARA